MRLKKKERQSVLHNELKAKIITLLAHEDDEVNQQAGQLILSLDVESVTDFIHLIMFEYECLLSENQELSEKLLRSEIFREKAESRAMKATPVGMGLSDIPWNE